MKKLLLVLSISLAFASCSNSDEKCEEITTDSTAVSTCEPVVVVSDSIAIVPAVETAVAQ